MSTHHGQGPEGEDAERDADEQGDHAEQRAQCAAEGKGQGLFARLRDNFKARLAGFATIGLGIMAIAGIMYLVLGKDPFDVSGGWFETDAVEAPSEPALVDA